MRIDPKGKETASWSKQEVNKINPVNHLRSSSIKPGKHSYSLGKSSHPNISKLAKWISN